jgi:hypothetical protein
MRALPFATLAAALAALLLVAAVPSLAVIAVWPLLCALPGWFLVSRAAPGLPAVGRTGVAVVASVYLSAHLVNLVAATTVGVRPAAVLGAAGTLVVFTWILARLPLPGLAPPPEMSALAAWQAVRLRPAPWLIAGACAGVVAGVLALSIWHPTPAGWVSGGWNWSDFLVHVSIGKSIAAGNYPPQVPYLAGVPLTYHWFAEFHGSLSALVAGIDIIPVYVFSSALTAAALALVSWELARFLTGSARVASLATVLLLLAGGMGFIGLPIDMAASGRSLADLVAENSYDNNWFGGWPYFRIPSVLGTGLLAHRATTFGLPGLLASVLLFAHSLGRWPAGVLVAGILAALLTPFHFFFFPASYLIVFIWVVTRREWRQPTARRDLALFLLPLVLAVPFTLGPALQRAEAGELGLTLAWEYAPLEDGPLGVAFFYLTNLGLPLVLALVALPLVMRRRDPPARWFLLGWLVALFLVPNVIRVSAIAFDLNNSTSTSTSR